MANSFRDTLRNVHVTLPSDTPIGARPSHSAFTKPEKLPPALSTWARTDRERERESTFQYIRVLLVEIFITNFDVTVSMPACGTLKNSKFLRKSCSFNYRAAGMKLTCLTSHPPWWRMVLLMIRLIENIHTAERHQKHTVYIIIRCLLSHTHTHTHTQTHTHTHKHTHTNFWVHRCAHWVGCSVSNTNYCWTDSLLMIRLIKNIILYF